MKMDIRIMQEQFDEDLHDVAPCHKAKEIMKWLREQQQKTLRSPDLNPIENLWSNLKRRVNPQKHANSDKLQKLIRQQWVGQIAGVLKERINSANIDSLY